MRKIILVSGLLAVLALSLFLSACGQSPVTSTSANLTTPSSPSTTTTQPVDTAGKTIFANNCARCHGANGQGGIGPAIIGAGASLDKYSSAKVLFNYVFTNMPFNAPGSLSRQEYLDVFRYLLIQNNLLTPGDAFSESELDNISLK